MSGAPSLFSHPLAVIDFEASALSLDSYPIEVGLALLTEPGEQMVTWSSLITPDPSWDIDAQWDPDAERLHGISRRVLREGLGPAAVVTELNARIAPGSAVWCDGGHYDQHWLDVLTRAAGVMPRFRLADLSAALREEPALRDRYLATAETNQRPHRAAADAAIIAVALAAAIAP